MRVIGHAIDCNQFLILSCDDSGHVLLQLSAAGGKNHTDAAGNRANDVQIICAYVLAINARSLHDAPNRAYRIAGRPPNSKHFAPTALAISTPACDTRISPKQNGRAL